MSEIKRHFGWKSNGADSMKKENIYHSYNKYYYNSRQEWLLLMSFLLKCNCIKKESSSKQTDFYEEPSVICTAKLSLSRKK